MNTTEIINASWDLKEIRFERAHRGSTWTNQDAKVAFLGIPKCGSTTIRNSLLLRTLTVVIA
jgi:hypothetical protein